MLSPDFSQLGLRPRRLRIKRYHARFRAIMIKYMYGYKYIFRLNSRGLAPEARQIYWPRFARKNGKRKKKREEKKREKSLITWLDKKGAKFARCVAVFLGEAEWKLPKLVQSFNRSTRCEWRSRIFEKCVWCSPLEYDIDLILPQKSFWSLF